MYKKWKNKYFMLKHASNTYLKVEKKKKYYYFIVIASKYYFKNDIIV